MSSSKRQQRLKTVRPQPPQSQEDDEFQRDLKELHELQDMTKDMETIKEFLMIKMLTQEETIRENYYDLIELTAYKGLCMIRHVAEETVGRVSRDVGIQVPSQEESHRQMINFLWEQMRAGRREQGIRQPNPSNLERPQQQNQQQNSQNLGNHERIPGSEQPINRLMQPRPQQRTAEQEELFQRQVEFLNAFIGIPGPIERAQPELLGRLLQNQHQFAQILHEMNILIDGHVFLSLYTFFILNQLNNSMEQNDQVILNPQLNHALRNQRVRNMYSEAVVEEMVRNIVRAKNQRRAEQQRINEARLEAQNEREKKRMEKKPHQTPKLFSEKNDMKQSK